MDTKQITYLSKFLSLVLRHQPETIGITLDAAGWVGVRDLLDAMARHNSPVSEAELQDVVANNSKKRFSFSEDGLRIRANQGHSVEIELGYSPTVPPDVLYHGTVDKFMDSIRAKGLLKGERHHVHLSADIATAENVGQRRGKPVLLRVHASRMHNDGIVFFISANGVWLTKHVPVKYIEFPTPIS